MSFDDLLRDTLSDDAWALPVPADTLQQVRRRRTARRRAQAGGAVLAVSGLVAGGVLLTGGSEAPSRSVVKPLAPPAPSDCDTAPAGRLPGSPYVVRSARDWFMTKAQSDAFFSTWNQPSPGPDAYAPSPQPSGPGTDRLVAALTAAGVPGADRLDRDEANSGVRGSLQLEGTLADGRSLFVSHAKAQSPYNTAGFYGSDTEDSSRDAVITQVPGTGCFSLSLAPKPVNGSYAQVNVIAPDGTYTAWSSIDVPLAQLQQWAYATATWLTEHPAG